MTSRPRPASAGRLAGAGLGALALGTVHGAPPDSPPDYETLTTELGMGILYEPCIGNAPDGNLCDPYTATYGDLFETQGFDSVRLRLGMDAFFANSTGTYPELSLTRDFFDGPGGLTAVVDDLLARDDGTMVVLISPKGLEGGTPDDRNQMARWWGEIATEYRDRTHRLIFNLMNEPLIRAGEFADMGAVEDLYVAITDEIRRTNPSRYLVYHRVHDLEIVGTAKRERTPYSDTGPGETDFNHMDMSRIDHRGRLIFDVHLLGEEDSSGNGEGKRDERLRQAWEFREATGWPVWSGAWNWGAWDTAFDPVELAELADLMKEKGIPGTYLMFNSSNTSIYDGNGTDRDGDGVVDEWTRPDYPPIITARNPIVWDSSRTFDRTLYAPTHDGFAGSGGASTQAKELRVDANAAVGLLKFDVTRLPPGTVTRARLRLKARAAGGDTVGVHLAGNGWDESDDDGNGVPALGWSTLPSYDEAPLASVVVTQGHDGTTLDRAVNDGDWFDPDAYAHPSWYEADVTDAVTGNGTYSFALVGTGGPRTSFWTRDSDGTVAGVGTWKYYPRLEVTVEPEAPPPAASDPSPADGERRVSTSPSLRWSAAADATAYEVHLGAEPGPLELVSTEGGTRFDANGLQRRQRYRWRVDAITPSGTVPGPLWSFRTGTRE